VAWISSFALPSSSSSSWSSRALSAAASSPAWSPSTSSCSWSSATSFSRASTQDDYSVTGAAIVICTIALLTVAMSLLSFKVPRLRPVLEGEPLILVEDGKPIERNLRRERLTMEELAAEARQQQIASLQDVRFAVLETNGVISFISK